MATIHGARVGLYVLLWLCSAVLLGLAATRIHYTLHLPLGDPLNNGQSFYDPIIVELLVSSVLAVVWSSYIIHVIRKRREYGRFSSFAFELVGLLVIFTLYLVGAAIATADWGDLFWCHQYWQCRLLTVLVAFAWADWALVVIALASVLFAVTDAALWHPLHGRYDGRDHHFRREPKRRWGCL
ncbi:hypothetical protein BD413DRAFT_610140 [Trametes elegans]|nr:hypothetical protein BD413DRAFT_610140 [Trametes elegans]